MSRILEGRDICVRFGHTEALKNAHLSAKLGEVVALLGPNGAGKTTLLKSLLGLIKHTGEVTITDDVGILLDDGGLLPGLTGRQHLVAVLLHRGLPAKRADELLELVDMARHADRKLGQYSLGMRRRIALAAALATQPKLLLLDEPANGLDPEGIRWLTIFLQRYAAAGNAVVISTHHLAEAAIMASKVTMINNGTTVYEGETQDNLEQHYFKLMGSES